MRCIHIILFLLPLFLRAQEPNWYGDIQPIIYKNCIYCHREGQIGPFSLLNYEDVNQRGALIKEVINSRFMPPWFADPAFNTYHNQRQLSGEEIQKINQWVDQGKPKGKKSNGIDVDQYLRAQQMDLQPDLTICMNRDFKLSGENVEQFRVFVAQVNNKDTLYVKGAEFVPGNRRLVHHSRIMIDTTNLLRKDDGIRVGDPSEADRLNIQLADKFWQGWIPGNLPVFYPKGIAKQIPPHADLVLNMHYSPTPVDATDRSCLRLYLDAKAPERFIKTMILDENWVSNPPFFIPPDTVIHFYMRSPMAPTDLSLISVLPHMHLLGKSIMAYAITPAGDLINLIRIPNWNFDWQMSYHFDRLIKIPKGSVIYAEAVFDNTLANPRNPRIPPQGVGYGWGTLNEMLNLIFEYVDYREGDENLPR